MYKILINRAFTEDDASPFKKIELHKKFNTQLSTIYKRDLLDFTKEEMCSKAVTNICMPSRDNENRLKGPPIIVLN